MPDLRELSGEVHHLAEIVDRRFKQERLILVGACIAILLAIGTLAYSLTGVQTTLSETRETLSESREIAANAIEESCERSRVLEEKLVTALTQLRNRPQPNLTPEQAAERERQYDELIASINTPPCISTDQLRPGGPNES